MTEWTVVHSTSDTKPLELDSTSSDYTVYERRNIRQEIVGDDGEQWVYEERQYSKEEYALLNGPQTQAIMQAMNQQQADIISALVMLGG